MKLLSAPKLAKYIRPYRDDFEISYLMQEMTPGDIIQLIRISHVAIGVDDLDRQTDFYISGCGLRLAAKSGGHVYLQGAGGHHHIFELVGDHDGLHHAAFQVAADADLDRAAKILLKQNVPVILGPVRDAEPGIGRLLRFRDPEGNIIELVADVEAHVAEAKDNTFRGPLSLNHLILYAGDLRGQEDFYTGLFNFRVTDNVPKFMTFLRCNPNHHSFGFIALPRCGLQHAAFDVPGRADLWETIVRLGDLGIRRIDGPGPSS
jgi:catechol-2,3-dioxygenase